MTNSSVILRPEECGTGTHGDNNGFFLAGESQCAGSAGGKLIHLAGRQTEYITLHKAGAHAGQDDAANVREGEMIGSQIITEGTVQAGDLIFCTNLQHGNNAAVRLQAYNFCSGATDINS